MNEKNEWNLCGVFFFLFLFFLFSVLYLIFNVWEWEWEWECARKKEEKILPITKRKKKQQKTKNRKPISSSIITIPFQQQGSNSNLRSPCLIVDNNHPLTKWSISFNPQWPAQVNQCVLKKNQQHCLKGKTTKSKKQKKRGQPLPCCCLVFINFANLKYNCWRMTMVTLNTQWWYHNNLFIDTIINPFF